MNRDPRNTCGEASIRRVVPLDGRTSVVPGFLPVLCQRGSVYIGLVLLGRLKPVKLIMLDFNGLKS